MADNSALNKGLEGVVALSSSISSIIDGVLTYRGYNIDDLADNTSFEEVVYLLWHDDLPNREQFDAFDKELKSNRSVHEYVLRHMEHFPKTSLPMEMLRTAVSLLGLHDKEANDNSEEANRRKAVRLTAQLPTLVAAIDRIRKGKPPVEPREDLSTAANFLYMLNGIEPDEVEVNAMDKALVLHADHELNASTFASRQTVSTLSDMYSGITSAIGTLKGQLHGGANERVMKTLLRVGSIDNVESFLDQALENKERIMGFGHRVYKTGDPRAPHLREMSKKLGELKGDSTWYDMSVKLHSLMEEKKGLKPNVDFYSASCYYTLGIPLDIYTPIFAMSRISGWLAHILEQYENNRLIRPRAGYIGATNRVSKPLDQR